MKTEYRYSNLDLVSLKKLAQALADFVSKGDVVLLQGDLGAGKTTFSRYALRELMHDADMDVPSPTFTLVQQYAAEKAEIWHFDLYRLEHEEEIVEIGWDEALTHGISLVEWPDRLGYYTPENYLECRLGFVVDDEDMRNLILTPHGAMIERMEKEWKFNDNNA